MKNETDFDLGVKLTIVITARKILESRIELFKKVEKEIKSELHERERKKNTPEERLGD